MRRDPWGGPHVEEIWPPRVIRVGAMEVGARKKYEKEHMTGDTWGGAHLKEMLHPQGIRGGAH